MAPPARSPGSSLPARLGRGLWTLPRRGLIGLVRVYQLVLSPLFPPSCRYTPTCSRYAIQALTEYGAVRGTILAVWRVLRCHPWGGHGYDPPRWFTEREAAPDRRRAGASPHASLHAPGVDDVRGHADAR